MKNAILKLLFQVIRCQSAYKCYQGQRVYGGYGISWSTSLFLRKKSFPPHLTRSENKHIYHKYNL